ncbi:HEAT repeat domain-containing protein [Microbacterium chocolatum]|uniref:HEAT repeat domain-containing protein n=1 Tax=Microbacterium aurantiacum TaxID=162393 RepID=UPI00338D9440
MAQQTGISTRMLRHYDRVGILRPTGRTASGYREHEEADLVTLLHIEGLRSLGLSLAQISAVISDDSYPPDQVMSDLIDRARDQIARSSELIRRLEAVQASQPSTWSDVSRTVELLRGLDGATPSQRQQAVIRARTSTDGELQVLIEALLQEANNDVAGALQWQVAQGGDAALPRLIDALASPAEMTRRRALDTLEKIGTPAAVNAIARSTTHTDPRIRGRAALFRARRGDTEVIDDLVAMISRGQDDVDASDALRELVTQTGAASSAVAAIARELAEGAVPARRRLAAALGEIPGDAATRLLLALRDDDDRGTALTARALSENRDPA